MSFTVRQASWPADRDALRWVREAVFVHEQGVPIALEWDGLDEPAVHVLACDEGDRPIGCGRLVIEGDAAHLGRMAVLAHWRGHGVGRALLDALMAAARARGLGRAWLNAQTTATAFYAKAGFLRMGKEFLDAGIPHLRMERAL